MLKMRQERERRGWSLVDITMKTGISPGDLSLIERGKRELFPGWKRRIAKAFGMSESELFVEAEDDKR